MKVNENTTFNGSYVSNTCANDKIEYCPYCGKKLPENANYCPFCGKEIPRTTTTPMIVYHWNTSDGRSTYPAGY